MIQLLQSQFCTLKQLQAVLGGLQWANAVILPGRAFLRRMIDGTRGVTDPRQLIYITDGMKEDLKLWLSFFDDYNDKTFFMPSEKVTSDQVHFYTDASKAGCGGFMSSRWFQVVFPPAWQGLDIALLEMYAVVVALMLFGVKLSNHRFVMHTDNQAVMQIVNCKTSRDKKIMVLVHMMVLFALRHNIKFTSCFIPGKQNYLADRISRFQVTQEDLRVRSMKMVPEKIPPHLLPRSHTYSLPRHYRTLSACSFCSVCYYIIVHYDTLLLIFICFVM